MIAYIKGTVLKIAATYTVIETNGVGYKVNTPVSAMAFLTEGETASFHIYTAVREDAIELYGFRDEVEQQAFEILIGVSGVGPKMALGVLSAMSVREIASAVRDDGARLQTVPGVGKKTAQRIALEVGEKLQELSFAAVSEEPQKFDALTDVIEGLVSLGYNRNDARKAAQESQKSSSPNANVAALLTQALALLNKS